MLSLLLSFPRPRHLPRHALCGASIAGIVALAMGCGTDQAADSGTRANAGAGGARPRGMRAVGHEGGLAGATVASAGDGGAGGGIGARGGTGAVGSAGGSRGIRAGGGLRDASVDGEDGATVDAEGDAADAGAVELTTLDLGRLDPAIVLKHRTAPSGLDEARAAATTLLTSLTTEQKLALVQGCDGKYVGNTAAAGAIPALTLHDGPAGVRGFRDVTAFPAPITIAATWDRDLARRWGEAMGREHRGKGVMIQLGPMINLSRVPAGGRNFEGFGEDPYLSSELVAKDIEGIQSQKVVATAKHYIGNEQETKRMTEDSRIDERTLHEVYYAPFESSVQAGAGAVMCSYNRIQGAYACDDPVTLGYLKNEMGFGGFVMSDWAAAHSTEAATAGLDMEMPSGEWFGRLSAAISGGTVSAARLDDMVHRILTSLLRIGVLQDPPTGTPSSIVSSAEHTALAREAATAGITLLRNEHSTLPLDPQVRTIAVIGSAADTGAFAVGGGSAEVTPPYIITPLSAIRARTAAPLTVKYAQGDRGASVDEAVSAAKNADAALVFVAVPSTEGEDRASLALPAGVDDLIAAVAKANARTVVVLHVPGAVMMPWIDQVGAVLVAWYPGQENGNAVSSVLFGDTNPGGRLPVTFPMAEADLPTPTDADEVTYTEKLGIGYRGLAAKGLSPRFPFGHGLSYTTYEYADLSLHPGTTPGSVQIAFSLTNTGAREGTETAQLYLSYPPSADEPPIVLRGFERVRLSAGERRRVAIELAPWSFTCWDATAHGRYVPSGAYRIAVGGSSRDLPLSASLEITGLPARPAADP